MKKICALVAIMTLLSGCLMNRYVLTGGEGLPPKSIDCPIRIFTAVPSGYYQQIGVIKYETPKPIWSIDRISQSDREFICKNGGNAILYQDLNDEDSYRTAAVLSVREE